MATKSIKVSEETYRKLVELAGKLQAELKKPVSIEDAIRYLMRRKISDLAGSWDISDEEVKVIKESLRRGWSTWKSSV
jgi:predicted CopG family antitoxin